jgi:hypothetical protein
MKSYRYAEEEKKKEDSEETEKEEAENLSNENEKQYKKEIGRKAQDEDEKKEAEEDDDDDNVDVKISEKDVNKLDLTDKQEEYLEKKKDSALAKQVASLKAEIRSLKTEARQARLEPIIDSILEAKAKLGHVDAEAEYRSLSKLDVATLQSLKADYDKIADANNAPRFTAKYSNASLGADRKYGDKVLATLAGDFD